MSTEWGRTQCTRTRRRKIQLLTCTVSLLGLINSTRFCGVLKWYQNACPKSPWANIKSPTSIIPPGAFSFNTATSTKAWAGSILSVCGWTPTLPPPPLIDDLVPGSISIKRILSLGCQISDQTWWIWHTPASSPQKQLLPRTVYYLPGQKVRHPIRRGGLSFRSQHWRTQAWKPPIRIKDKENSQCSPPREQNVREMWYEKFNMASRSRWPRRPVDSVFLCLHGEAFQVIGRDILERSSMEAWKRKISTYKLVSDDIQPDGTALSNVDIIFADLALSSAIPAISNKYSCPYQSQPNFVGYRKVR